MNENLISDDKIDQSVQSDKNNDTELKKINRSNAKAVEAYDLDGNLIDTYPSGLLASKALNIQQGDISLCCRGLKPSINGYKFKFASEFDEQVDSNAKLRRGYALEVIQSTDQSSNSNINFQNQRTDIVTRSTRTSRGEHSIEGNHVSSILAPADAKTRKWRKVFTTVSGGMIISKWLPDREVPTQALQKFKPKAEGLKKKSTRRLFSKR
mmetsp:Transcript_23506/g.21380  ORF Transcript_23506/g.21380 Transcript_23506/m.21380 type:complete len:210 (+) Transcript_23506:3-632(+)